MALAGAMSLSNELTPSIGQCSAHTPQPVHLSSRMYLECFVIVTLKSPAFPSTFLSSAWVRRVMFSCLPVATSFGDTMHIAQSLVGKVLSSCAIVPPLLRPASSMYTL